ncbi:MAG: hypothetical protein JST23_01540 [Bacteroidetes bacterium]|nr:hypothetical protein [Bacteroidota bacterium]
MKKKLILIGIIFIFVYASCYKSKDCNRAQRFAFTLPVSVSPGTDSINLGDTLWIKIEDSTLLYDSLSNSFINYSQAGNLGYNFAFLKVISATELLPIADSLVYIIKAGYYAGTLNPLAMRAYRLMEDKGKYNLELGILPQTRGVYRVMVEPSANVYSKGYPCAKTSFGVRFNQDQHFYLGYNIWGPGVYYFKVK